MFRLRSTRSPAVAGFSSFCTFTHLGLDARAATVIIIASISMPTTEVRTVSMGRKISEEARRQREELQERVKWILDNLYRGKQRRMAAELGVSQSLISRVTNGR